MNHELWKPESCLFGDKDGWPLDIWRPLPRVSLTTPKAALHMRVCDPLKLPNRGHFDQKTFWFWCNSWSSKGQENNGNTPGQCESPASWVSAHSGNQPKMPLSALNAYLKHRKGPSTLCSNQLCILHPISSGFMALCLFTGFLHVITLVRFRKAETWWMLLWCIFGVSH